MAKTNFEGAKNFLKSHPDARPITRRQRDVTDFTHQPALDRHSRKCQVCHHPYRREIEADYLRWRSLREIASSFGLADQTSVWRHACATGLRDDRQRRIAYALHPLLEQSEDTFIKATPSAIISAVRTYSQINDEGRRRRTKPVTHIYVTNEARADLSDLGLQSELHWVPGLKEVARHSLAAPPSGGPPISRHSTPARRGGSNRNIQELEDDSTH